jgi:hypothetical protein
MRKKLIEVALPLEAINRDSEEVDPARTSFDATPLVGAAAAGGVSCGAVRLAGR